MGKLIRLQPQLLKLILHGNQHIKQRSIITLNKQFLSQYHIIPVIKQSVNLASYLTSTPVTSCLFLRI